MVGMVGIHHILMMVLYLIPTNPIALYYRAYVSYYMEPLFEQRWQLFAPDPALYGLKFWYRCGDNDGHETQWLDPTNKILKQHQQWRVGPYGKMLYVYTGLARGYLNEYITLADQYCTEEQRKESQKCLAILQDKLDKTDYAVHAQKLAALECQKHVVFGTLSSLNWVQFQAVKVHPREFSRRTQTQSFSRIEFLPSSKVKMHETTLAHKNLHNLL